MERLSFTLFLDESGNELLYPLKEFDQNSSLETHCTLMGVIVANNKKDVLGNQLRELKKDIWRSDEIVLHSVDVRSKRGAFALFHYQPDLYEQFKERMNAIISEIEPTLICSSLNKVSWIRLYPRKLTYRDDAYCQAFVYLLERYAHFLNAQAQQFPSSEVVGKIVVEERAGYKNSLLSRTYRSVMKRGTQYYDSTIFKRLSPKLEFKTKAMNIAGLQLSDYCCYPFYVNHKYPIRENKFFEFLDQFIYSGDRNRYGHKKWPT